MTAVISHVYSLSFWLHSDALFCLVATAAMLIAFQINGAKTTAALPSPRC